MTHPARMALATRIADTARAHFGERVLAIALYGSLALGADGPFSDIDMVVVLSDEILETHEWCAGPWKAEVNVVDALAWQRAAAQLNGEWARTHGAFVRTLPLYDPVDYFAAVRTVVLDHTADQFQAAIEEVLVGDIYELIGKVRNARTRRSLDAIPVLAVQLAQTIALLLGLEHRHLYTSSSSVLREAAALPDLPDQAHALLSLVMQGRLTERDALAYTCDRVWDGLVEWAAARAYRMVAVRDLPW